MANSLSFDSTDMSSSSYGVFVEEFREPWMSKPITNVHEVPTGQTRISGVSFEAAVISIPVVITGTSTLNLRVLRDAIALLLDPLNGEKKLSIDAIPGRHWYGMLVGGMPVAVLGASSVRAVLKFQTTGYAYDDSETSSSQAIATDPDTLTEAVGGTAKVNPVIYVRNETGGNVTSVQVNNTTASESITWTGTLTDDHWLRIGRLDDNNRFRYRISTSNASGADPTVLSYTQAMSGVSASGGDWPRMIPNVTNSFTITGVSTGTFQLVYRDRYIGG